MGTRSYYLEENSFILNKFSGDVSDEGLSQLINKINDKAGNVPDLRELADCRDLQSIDDMTVEGTISNSKEEVNRPQSLLAILIPEYNQQIRGMAKVYQSFSEATRKAVKIFSDLEEAISWLAHDEQEKEVLRDFIRARSAQ